MYCTIYIKHVEHHLFTLDSLRLWHRTIVTANGRAISFGQFVSHDDQDYDHDDDVDGDDDNDDEEEQATGVRDR